MRAVQRLVIAVLMAAGTAGAMGGNPILPGADPHALTVEDAVWVYPTWSGDRRGRRFFAFSSTDLVDWQRHGPVLDFDDVSWIDDDGAERHYAWAPSVVQGNGKWYLYYSVGPQHPTPSRIGVAVADSPAGPFRDSGKPLLTGGDGFEAIDPMVFTDPVSGKTYFYAGGSAGATLRVFEMNPDLVSFAREISVPTPPEFTEGAFMHCRDGRYYLSYSHGDYRRSSYSVHYAVSDSPVGPWDYQGAILVSDESRKGPGHHSFLRDPKTGQWLIFYHRWENRTGDGPYRGSRQICIEPVEYERDGRIRPIRMTCGGSDGTIRRRPSTRSGEMSAAPTAETPMVLEYTNPVWDGYLADPQVLKTDGGYYAYGTGPEHEGRQFPVLHSKDFVHWEFVGNALETVTEPKMEAYWAPEVAEKDGRFYLYYAGSYKMRVAVADHPAGPFKDVGKILFPDEPFSIDGHPYRDPKSGKWYLFFAKDYLDGRVGTALAVAELGEDMTSVVGPVKTVLRAVGDWQIYERDRSMYGQVFDKWHTVEAPFVVFRDGQYTCFYSGGNWQTPGYGVGFAVSDHVTGPYRDEVNLEGATVLKSIPGRLIGPGHNSVVVGPDGQTQFIVYHSWNPERTRRQMCLDPIAWTPRGPRAYQPSRGHKRVVLPFHPGGASGEGAEDNWPNWRGPHGDGTAAGGEYPVEWDPENVLWKAEIPGKGFSTPIVWDQRIYLTTGVEGLDTVLALDWSGKPLWQRQVGPEVAGKHPNASGSNPSAATDGSGVFVLFKSGTLAALEMDGTVRWRSNLFERYGRDDRYWDFGTSPVLTEKDVVVAQMHDGDSWVAAFDKTTGEVHWKVPRNYETPREGRQGYGTPIVFSHEGKEALLIWGGQHLTAHDASDGKVLWSCGDFNPEGRPLWPSVASPVISGETVVVPCGRADRNQPRLHGIKLGGSGDVTETHRLWKREDIGTFVPTPAAWQGRVYVIQDRGRIDCIDPLTGKSVWSGVFPEGRGNFYTSPLIAGGHLYAARESGMFYVLRLGETLEVVSEIDMGDRIIASPIGVSGRLFIRTGGHLFCIGNE